MDYLRQARAFRNTSRFATVTAFKEIEFHKTVYINEDRGRATANLTYISASVDESMIKQAAKPNQIRYIFTLDSRLLR